MNRGCKILGVALLSITLLAACREQAGIVQGELSEQTAGGTAGAAAGGEGATVSSGSGTVEQAVGGGGLGVQSVLSSAAELAAIEADDTAVAWSSEAAVAIRLSGATAVADGAGVTVESGTITISAPGTYMISGKLDDGQLVVDCAVEGTVRLVLNGVDMTSSVSAPIYVKQADKTIITLAEGTVNTIADAQAYVYPDAATDEPNAAVFSKDDLTINGEGKLIVQANYNNAITSKDDLKITGGEFVITSADDGLLGRDLLAITGGSFTIQSRGDGLKSSNEDADKGNIAITGGSFVIEAGSDGMQAENALLIDDGTFTITTAGGSAARLADDASSAKALKAGVGVYVFGGTFKIDAADDAVHSNGDIAITGGEFAIQTGDDAVHADGSVAVSGGMLDITRSYEGIEGANIEISGGDIRIVASDDGINVSVSDDAEAASGVQAGRGGQPRVLSGHALTIAGGYVYVDAQGDGLDSNGSIVMTGGTVIVNGPTGNGDGALDFDGTFEHSGGILIAAGSAGMPQSPTAESSRQSGIMMTFPQVQAAGTIVRIEDTFGNDIVTFAPSKPYQTIYISTPDLTGGASYTLYSGGASTADAVNGLYSGGQYTGGTRMVQFELSSVVTWVNESGVTAAGMGMPGGFGGGNPNGGSRGGRGSGAGAGAGRMAPPSMQQ